MFESRQLMNPMIGSIDSRHTELMAVVTEAIRRVSAKARETSITSSSLLLEDLALDSLDLVAVVLRVQDHFQVEIDADDISNLRSVHDLTSSLASYLRAAA